MHWSKEEVEGGTYSIGHHNPHDHTHESGQGQKGPLFQTIHSAKHDLHVDKDDHISNGHNAHIAQNSRAGDVTKAPLNVGILKNDEE